MKTAALAVLITGCASLTDAQLVRGTARDLLATNAGFTAAQAAAIERGEIVVRAVPTDDARDVLVIGGARAERSRTALVNEARVAGRASRRAASAAIHVFGSPARVADVNAIELTKDDVDELQRCRPDACNFKVPAVDIAALRAVPAGPDQQARITAYIRQHIVDFVTAYRQGHPGDSLPGAENTVYWSVDALPRVRPTLRIMDEVVYTPEKAPGTSVIAAKQLYANHYFDAGLELIIIDDPATTSGGSLVVSMRRYRFDRLPVGPLDIRGRVVDGLCDAVSRDLQRLATAGKP